MGITVLADFHMDQIGMAANRTVFDIFLFGSCGKINRKNYILATGSTSVACFVLHCDHVPGTSEDRNTIRKLSLNVH